MFIEKVKSEGLAHLSWVVGNDGRAAVVDPRRDCDIYIEIAAANGCRITHILETHRNEDLISGAPVLAERTGATVWHGPDADGDVVYAETVDEGTELAFDNLKIRVLQTPGHTDDSVSYVVYDTDFGDPAVAVFTGDALFIGDVGRTDFYPDRAREVAGLLYDSLNKLLALGDQAVLLPAHGAGSVCGSGMADREVSTLGYERRTNPRLQFDDRESFIDFKVAEHHEQPPYFRLMEQLNLEGGGPVPESLTPPPLEVDDFSDLAEHAVILDVRSASAFLGAHVPGSLAIPVDMLAAFAGWLLDPEDALVLVADDAAHATEAATELARIGFDRVRGYLEPSLVGWASQGESFAASPVVSAETVRERLREDSDGWTLLDVREPDEVEGAYIPGATATFIGRLPESLDEFDSEAAYTVMCGSGARATIAASLLLRAGRRRVDLFLGSMGAWQEAGFEIEEAS
jgi:hydroxyacylglutathione hydrolase